MTYRPIHPPENTPKVVRELLNAAIDPFFADVHAMLRLPLPSADIGAGCGFAITHVLLAAASGLSVLLYQSQGGSGQLFRDFLEHYYPWHDEPQLPNVALRRDGAETLYDEYRNPFTHASGVSIDENRGKRQLVPREYVVKVLRRVAPHAPDEPQQGMPESEIEAIELDNARPAWLAPTLIVAPHKCVLSVEGLY